ncbi:MAG: DNA repair protein RecO [Patescibacteria group bacterium]
MSQTYKTEGIVLKASDYRDADRLYKIYTKDFGKIIVRAQGVKKTKSKMAGHVEPFCLSDFFIAKTKTIDKLAGAKQKECFYNLRKNYEKISVANYLVEIYDSLIGHNEKDEVLFSLLKDNLVRLNKNEINWLIIKASILKILKGLGYEPDLSDKSDLNKVLKFLIYEDFNKISRLKISDDLWKDINRKVDIFLKEQLDYDLQTENFLI